MQSCQFSISKIEPEFDAISNLVLRKMRFGAESTGETHVRQLCDSVMGEQNVACAHYRHQWC